MQVLDYSAGNPGANSIKAAGYGGAVRYIGFPDRSKCTTAAELTDFTNHALGMALVFENTTTDWRGGYAVGQASARRARDHANTIGFPADRPIYMAVDQDVVTAADFELMLAYLRGANTSLGGPYVTGVYGEADVIDRARDAGVASWFWQTTAWSRGRRTAAHLFQLIGTVYVGGIACDTNEVLKPDWGQHGARRTDVELTTSMAGGTPPYFWGGTTVETADVGHTLANIYSYAKQAATDAAATRAAVGQLTNDEANVLAAMQANQGQLLVAVAAIQPGVKVTDEQMTKLAADLRTTLGDAGADELVRRLSGQVAL